jgi:Cdc6-like AAA superfamily ATPase
MGSSEGFDPELDEKLQKEAAVGEAFSPSAPVTNRDLFAGRTTQIRELINIVSNRGQHGVVYGERGVGKTSLVSVATIIVHEPDRVAVRVNCDATDTFGSIWTKVLSRVQYEEITPGVGFSSEAQSILKSAAERLPEEPTPNDVEAVLGGLSRLGSLALFIDEFDRISDPDAPLLMADTIKTLSDQGHSITIVLVGVADNVAELIAEHASIERALVQVRMPRMSAEELREIVYRGLERVEMTIQDEATERIVALSQGLPHYTHLLTQEAAKAAVWDDTMAVGFKHVLDAMAKAIKRTGHTLAERYHAATQSPRAKTLYPDILLASALAPGDQLGYFAASDVREPLRAIAGKEYEIPAFSPHLHELCEESRGAVLQKTGQPRRFRFRFRNPLMQPYVIMRALAENHLDSEVMDMFLSPKKKEDS